MDQPKILESLRLHPSTKPDTCQQIPLSILDGQCARFSPCGAFWVFDQTPEGVTESSFIQNLRRSLVDTLDIFPQWTGQLQWAPTRKNGTHTERFNRAQLLYGTDADPGLEWKVVRQSFSSESIAPDPIKRATGPGVWVGNDLPQALLVSDTPLPLHNLRDSQGLPCMTVQLNLLQNEGYVISIKMSHLLADAQSLLVFTNQWAMRSQSLFGGEESSSSLSPSKSIMPPPVFDPAALDARAAGDIDGLSPDPSLIKTSRSLPLHRYDWWSRPGNDPSTDPSRPPPHLLPDDGSPFPEETPAPWDTWDFSAPVTFALIHFTPSELAAMKESASSSSSSSSSMPPTRISRLDALLSHLFATITLARESHKSSIPSVPSSSLPSPPSSPLSIPPDNNNNNNNNKDNYYYLNVTLSARTRVPGPSGPLPEGFLGSPLFMTHIGTKGSDIVTNIRNKSRGEEEEEEEEAEDGKMRRNAETHHHAHLASSLRETMSLFTPPTVGAMLHDAAFEAAPQRVWQGFCGARHLLATSWLRLPVYEVDFVGCGNGGRQEQQKPRYVHPVMPKVDGILQVLDGVLVGDGDGDGDKGMDVSLYLEKGVMEKVVSGETGLRRWKGPRGGGERERGRGRGR